MLERDEEFNPFLMVDTKVHEKADTMIVLACRPSEISFLGSGGVPGRVKRKSFLGEVVDYAIDISGTEVRVQKSRRIVGPEPGENCHLDILSPHWYGAEK